MQVSCTNCLLQGEQDVGINWPVQGAKRRLTWLEWKDQGRRMARDEIQEVEWMKCHIYNEGSISNSRMCSLPEADELDLSFL
jgi:hypothetical protein